MTTVKVKAVDMSDRLNAEGKYQMKVKGHAVWNSVDAPFYHPDVEHYIDLSELDIDQIGVIAGFLDAVFDDLQMNDLTAVSIDKKDVEEE